MPCDYLIEVEPQTSSKFTFTFPKTGNLEEASFGVTFEYGTGNILLGIYSGGVTHAQYIEDLKEFLNDTGIPSLDPTELQVVQEETPEYWRFTLYIAGEVLPLTCEIFYQSISELIININGTDLALVPDDIYIDLLTGLVQILQPTPVTLEVYHTGSWHVIPEEEIVDGTYEVIATELVLESFRVTDIFGTITQSGDLSPFNCSESEPLRYDYKIVTQQIINWP